MLGLSRFILKFFSTLKRNVSLLTSAVAGFSLEFALLNVSGFFFYAMYSTGGFIFPYSGTGKVAINDLAFGWHAFMIASI